MRERLDPEVKGHRRVSEVAGGQHGLEEGALEEPCDHTLSEPDPWVHAGNDFGPEAGNGRTTGHHLLHRRDVPYLDVFRIQVRHDVDRIGD